MTSSLTNTLSDDTRIATFETRRRFLERGQPLTVAEDERLDEILRDLSSQGCCASDLANKTEERIRLLRAVAVDSSREGRGSHEEDNS